MDIVLRPHQVEAADAVEAAFRAGIKRPLMDMCVAAGKSLTYAELARREISRGGRVLAVAPSRELVEQIEGAGLSIGLQVGVNSAALGKRTWRAPMISASINSVYTHAGSFGPISLLIEDEGHLASHGEAGMLHALRRGLGNPRVVGGTGTPFRLMGGSLVEGEGAPYDKIVYRYSIVDGIRDGYLVPPFSAPVDDTLNVEKLRVAQGEYTGSSQDVQMLEMADNHIAQMLYYGRDRRTWLVFEASAKAATAMALRMNQWGIPTGLILGDRTSAEAANRKANVEALRSRKLRALVNVRCLTTGFDVQGIDMLVCRRRTKSLSLWMQILGRLLRTIDGNMEASIAAGKCDGLLLDFAGNLDEFGPLDFVRPAKVTSKMISCESCGMRNASAAAKCWSCDEPMMKNCPVCLEPMQKGLLDCPSCGHDMRAGPREESKGPKLAEVPSGAALLKAWGKGTERAGGWLPIRKVWASEAETIAATENGDRWVIPAPLSDHAPEARWLRADDASRDVVALLVPNGASRTSARQIMAGGVECIVPLPAVLA